MKISLPAACASPAAPAAKKPPSQPLPMVKTYPTTSAGPHRPTFPLLRQTLLRLIPGVPRHAVAPIAWLRPQPANVVSLELEARLNGGAAATIALPVPSPSSPFSSSSSTSPIPPSWFDFLLEGDSLPASEYLTFTLTASFSPAPDAAAPPPPLTLSTVLLLSDFASLHGELVRPMLEHLSSRTPSASTPVAPAASLTLSFLATRPAQPCPFAGAKVPFVPRFSGHRGSGSSGPAPGRAHRVLENSTESFLLAALGTSADANAGHEFQCKTVELDVQITRDHRTVVFHDWYLRPARRDGHTVYDHDAVKLPLYELTFAQFDELYRRSYGHWGDIEEEGEKEKEEVGGECEADDTSEEIDRTSSCSSSVIYEEAVDNKQKKKIPINEGGDSSSSKGKSGGVRRGDPVERAKLRSYATGARGVPADAFRVRALSLRDVCDLLPADINLLVEIKYPVPPEDGGAAVSYPERNEYIELVLADLYASARNAGREIAFLSFDPDVAAMVAMKQGKWASYLSQCGGIDPPCNVQDPRCVDVAQAHRFVRAARLDGLMLLNSLALEHQTRQVGDAVQDGVPILTYGARNSDPECVRRQFEIGISGVIADDVRKVLGELAREGQ